MFIWQWETITSSTSLFILAIGKNNSDSQWKWSQFSSLFQRTIDSCFTQPMVFCPQLGLPLMLLGICNSLSIHPASHLHCWTLSSLHTHFKQDLARLYTPIPLLSLSSMNLRNWSWGDHPLVSSILLRHLSITSCDYSPLLISRCVSHLMLSLCFLTQSISQIGYILPS